MHNAQCINTKEDIGEMREGARKSQLRAFYRAELEFHRTIWSLSGNRHLAKALENAVVPLFAFFIRNNPRIP
jgi:DNA-binding GntR family transcriptional regulator